MSLHTLMKASLFTMILFAVTSSSYALDIKIEQMIKEFAGEKLNVREGPGMKYKVLRTIVSRTRGIEALEKQGSWIKIKWGKRQGWVHEKYLENVYNIDASADYAVDTVRGALNARYAAGQQQRKLFVLPHGTKKGISILALKEVGKTYWARIAYKGKIGWVNAKYLKVAKPKKVVKAKRKKTAKSATKGKSRYYRVRSGDTLFRVMRKTGVSWKKLARLNNLDAPYDLRKGQRLKLR